MISGEMPGTAEKSPAVMPAKSASREDDGRPASVAAGTTYLGMLSWSLLFRTAT